MLAGVFISLASCRLTGGPSDAENPAVDLARSELRSCIEDVTRATASRYGVKDDRGNVMDTVKIIPVPEAGGFAGVYNSYRDDSGAFYVHLATSHDLMNWTWRTEIAAEASQSAIQAATDGGYVLAWEQEPENHLKFAFYSSWANLLEGVSSKTFEAPRELSDCAEGTPNLYSASNTLVEAGFHFNASCDLDRQARGTTDWSSWTPSERPLLDRAVLLQGVMGGVGDRDVLNFKGFEFTFIEGQLIRDDWSSWRIFLYDDFKVGAEQLDIRTHAGSVAFSNPTIAQIEIDRQQAILVTLFIPQEGAAGAEAGELVYYRTCEIGPEI
jgi:hypothetical protein